MECRQLPDESYGEMEIVLHFNLASERVRRWTHLDVREFWMKHEVDVDRHTQKSEPSQDQILHSLPVSADLWYTLNSIPLVHSLNPQ